MGTKNVPTRTRFSDIAPLPPLANFEQRWGQRGKTVDCSFK